jgi:hypothetical protein
MTSTNTVPPISAPSAATPSATTKSEVSKKRLRAPSEPYKKPKKVAVPSAARNRKGGFAGSSQTTIRGTNGAVAEHPRQTKSLVVEALLTREGGASLKALCEATGWQPHTCRAFLTGLRKKGREVIRASDKDGNSIYLIAPHRLSSPSPTAPQAEAESA